MSVFVDTNVLIYAHDVAAGERHDRAKLVVRDLWQRPDRAAVSVQVLQELYVNLRRKAVPARDAERITLSYLSWPVVVNDGELLAAAMKSASRWTISFWDALVIEAARKAGAAELWTEDLNDGQDFDGVRIVNPLTRS